MQTMIDIHNLQGEYRTGKVLDDGVIVTPVCRLSYPHLFERTVFENDGQKGKPTFNCSLIFNCSLPGEPGLVDIMSIMYPECQRVAAEFWAAKQKPVPFQYHLGFYDGQRKIGKEGYGAGYWYISPKNHDEKITNVPIVDGNLNPLGPAQIKGGDFVRARIIPYISKKNEMYAAKGVNFGLKSIQLIMPWHAFSQATPDTGQEFGAVPVPMQTAAPVDGRGW